MKKALLVTLGGVALAVFASTVMAAQPGLYRPGGWYVQGQAGATFLNDADNDGFTTEFKTGYNLGGAIGVDLGTGLRLEGEAGYRENDVDKFELGGIAVSGSGDMSALSFMANAFYDIDTGTPLKPYVGGGIGVASVSLNDARLLGARLVDDDDTVFAWQVGAGVGYAVNPQTTLSLDYRYFATEDPSFKDSLGQKFDSEYGSNNVSVSLRYKF